MRNVIIMGSGPAGLTAAIYTARANLSPVLIEGVEAGGQLALTTEVENYPGFHHAIMGPELIKEMRAQAGRFGTEFLRGDVSSVDLKATPITLTLEGEQTLQTRALIIASGARANMLGLESERRLLGHGVSTCATCDGFFFRGQKLLVVGGGDSAIEEALFLTRFATKVTVIHRRDQLRASKIMQDRAFAHQKIDFVWDSVVEDILGDGQVAGARVRNVKTDEARELPAGGVFVAIGHSPNTSLFEGQIETHNGYIVVREPTTETSIEGVFAAGDVVDFTYRQAITAAGMGCQAVIDAERFLEAQGH